MSGYVGRAHAGSHGDSLRAFAQKGKKEVLSKPHALNGLTHHVYSSQIFTFNRVFAMIMLAQLLLLYLYVQYDLQGKQFALAFLEASNATGIIACLILSIRYYSKNQQYAFKDEIQDSLAALLTKIAIVILAPYDFLDNVTLEFQDERSQNMFAFKVNHLLTIVAYFKIFIFSGVVLTASQYMQPRANRISKLYGTESGNVFAIKAIFKDSPFYFVLIVFSISLVTFSFAFRVAQSQVYASSGAGTVYLNMIWMTMTTMTTVGYGDYVPQTPVGRIIGSLCITWGALILSVTVVVLTSAFSMNRKQTLTLRMMNKLEHRSELRSVAGELIRETLWRKWTNYKYRLNKRTKLKERKLIHHFQLLRRAQSNSFQCSSEVQLYTEFLNKFGGALSNVDKLTSNNVQLINHLSEQYIFKPELSVTVNPNLKIMVNARKK